MTWPHRPHTTTTTQQQSLHDGEDTARTWPQTSSTTTTWSPSPYATTTTWAHSPRCHHHTRFLQDPCADDVGAAFLCDNHALSGPPCNNNHAGPEPLCNDVHACTVRQQGHRSAPTTCAHFLPNDVVTVPLRHHNVAATGPLHDNDHAHLERGPQPRTQRRQRGPQPPTRGQQHGPQAHTMKMTW